ncbi:flagellar biosynthetic protein FliP [Butyrivibrio fibrisolvens DSM 3071]|jgi:flagellar biosynthetic protein FliP|uniref:Flagellar biosynthetic protein FliP n=1 Tax=Butyrivibrio fibrisolvens DSM 3071 TaxID=1121131 RepID=A0A1M5YUD4_BUTFI|nr:flagellar type III secretion system pore protein FliP [Butyrivibrio fibrisolvens]SHI15444.1 flagellar biosynthetic protein FliP [Butyrivibrio fibrisolvens DSM 3071]
MRNPKGKDNIRRLLSRAVISTAASAVMVAFLSFAIPIVSTATEAGTEYVDDTTDTDPTVEPDYHLTGTDDERTNIKDPGTAETAEDLSELNIANYVTVTYDNGNGDINGALRIFITLTLLALLPSIIIMMTSFTRIILVLHFTRTALNTQTAPPNMVLVGLALFLTFYIMQPTILRVYNEAYVPFNNGEVTQQEFLDKAMKPIREFMYPQTQRKDVVLFMEISGDEWDGTLDDIPTTVLVPSFMISELRTGFIIGFLIYIPFIVIDMVVASVLMSMGMMMLPPTTISMPFKILLFVLADGWNLIIGSLVKTFY